MVCRLVEHHAKREADEHEVQRAISGRLPWDRLSMD
jgi:hypothetical protein